MRNAPRAIVVAAALAGLSTLSFADDESGDSERTLGGYFLGAKHVIFVGTTRQSIDANISATAEGFDFSAGGEIETELDIDAYLIDVMYRLSESESYEFLIGAGIHALDLGPAIGAQAFVGDTAGEFRRSSTLASRLATSIPRLILPRRGIAR